MRTMHQEVMRESASSKQPTFRPTQSQIAATRLAAKRDWPAGEPRIDWINKATAQVLLREGIIVERPDSVTGSRGNIIDLTPAGEALLASI